MLMGIRVRKPHKDGDLAVRVTNAGTPPLTAIQHHFVTFNHRRCFHGGCIGRGYGGLSHAERRTDFAAEQTR